MASFMSNSHKIELSEEGTLNDKKKKKKKSP